MKNLKIYLCGAMQNCKNFEHMNSWRVMVANALIGAAEFTDSINLEICNPCDYYNFEEKRHKTDREVMEFDLAKVRESDIVIVNLEGINTSIGSAMELYEAYTNRIPVIAYNPFGLYNDIHPWIQTCITREEDSISGVKNYIKDFYMK